MASDIITVVGSVTEDESPGLQNTGTATTVEDNNDDDVAFNPNNPAVPFATRLFDDTELNLDPNAVIGVAESDGDVITLSTTGTLGDILFTDANGDVLNGASSGLFTADGDEILLFTDTEENNIVLGKDADGNVIFAILLEQTQTGGKFWVVQFEALGHTVDGGPSIANFDDALDLNGNLAVTASETLTFSFVGAPSGQNLFLAVGDDSGAADAVQIVVTGRAPNPDNLPQGDTIVSSQAGTAATIGVNNQMFNPGEGAFFSFVTGMSTTNVAPNLDPNEADVEANIDFKDVFGATAAEFTIAQTEPNSKDATVQIEAFTTEAEPGTGFVEGLEDDTHVDILSVQVVNDTNGSATATIDPVTGIATIKGLDADDAVQYTTDGEHNRLLIENPTSATTNFDVGDFTLLQANTDTEVVGTAVRIEDDGPTAVIVRTAAAVTHDETAGVDADANDTTSAAVAALFSGVTNVSTDISPAGFAQNANPVVDDTGSSFGADGAGTTVFSLSISAAGLDSGLNTTDGTDILLFKEGDLVVGRIASQSGQAAFAVALDGTTGVMSLAQYASLQHPVPSNADEPLAMIANKVQAVVTVTDQDGDFNTATVNVGDKAIFQDDGPTAAIVTTAAAVTHDETAGVDADANDTTNPAVAALFAGVSNVSTDLSPAGFAQNASAVVASTGSSFGQDEEAGTTSFSLSISAAGLDSGLKTTDGSSVLLFKEGSLVVGRIGSQAGAAAFAFALDSATGVLSLAQYASLDHLTASNPDDELAMAANKIQALATVTDGDGDTSTASVNIGDKGRFQDDGPSIAPDDGFVDFAAGATDKESLHLSFGEDEETATVKITTFTDLPDITETKSVNDTVLTYSNEDGALFRLTLNNDGTYTFAVLQDPPQLEVSLDFSAIASGGPKETLLVPATGTDVSVLFDGVIFGAGSFPNNFTDFDSSDVDDLNPDNLGFGVKQGQASQLNHNEGFFFEGKDSITGSHVDLSSLSFDIQGIGNTSSVIVDFWLIPDQTDPTSFEHVQKTVQLPTGNNVVNFEVSDPDAPEFDLAFVRFTYTGNVTNKGVRLLNFETTIPQENPDQLLEFGVQATDGDGDTDTDTFNVGIDGNHDGQIIIA